MATDTKVKNPLLLVGTKSQITAAGMGENDFGVATDVEFYTAAEVDERIAATVGDISAALDAINGEVL